MEFAKRCSRDRSNKMCFVLTYMVVLIWRSRQPKRESRAAFLGPQAHDYHGIVSAAADTTVVGDERGNTPCGSVSVLLARTFPQ